MKAALLPHRGIVKVVGPPARNFLNGLLTADVSKVTPTHPCFAALLTPQGKIVVDCIVAESQDGDAFILDCPRTLARTLVDKLDFYKLRTKVTVQDVSDALGVLAVWGGEPRCDRWLSYPDPRLRELGWRIVLPTDLANEAMADLGADIVDARDYDMHRIALGIPCGGVDFTYGDAFPHEADMDQLNGVDFAKGCYIGQEVVSRMQHRGSVRTRVVAVAYDGVAPQSGTAVLAGEKQVGTFGSASDGRGLAILRFDRVDDAIADDVPITAGRVTLRIMKPDWARFAVPGEPKAAE